MDTSRTLIRSSIVSLIIVSFGLFMLCMSRAPRINTNNSTLQGGGGENSASASGDEQDLLNLLNEAGDEMNLGDESNLLSEESKTETASDDELTALLNEGDSDLAAEQSNESNEKDSMDELLQLLGSDEAAKYSEDQPLDSPKELSILEKSENSSQQTDASAVDNNQAINGLKDQISTLEQVLADRKTEKESLQSQLQKYDLQLAELESRSSSSGKLNHSITQTAYSDAQPTSVSMAEKGSMNSFFNDATINFKIAYREAQQLFQQHRYSQAANRFYQLLQLNQRHPLADNCQYWIGECYFAQGKYYQAIAEFTKVAAYDAADKKDDAQIMIGLAFMKLGQVQHAQSELDWLVSAFASSEYVSTAYRYLRQL